MSTKLSDLAPVIRSKNAEPYLSTIDVYFAGRKEFETARDSGALTEERVAELYNLPLEAVYGIYFIEAVNAAKVTIYKYNEGEFRGSGDPIDGDIFGAQQYVPLLDLEIE